MADIDVLQRDIVELGRCMFGADKDFSEVFAATMIKPGDFNTGSEKYNAFQRKQWEKLYDLLDEYCLAVYGKYFEGRKVLQ